MTVATLISEEEYLSTSFPPDVEFRDGVLVERHLGEEAHSWLQGQLLSYMIVRQEPWNIKPYPELRIDVRKGWHPVPDLCVYPEPGFEGRYPSIPPLLWIEILSDDDKMPGVWARANELIQLGVPYFWIIDPRTLDSELRTAEGIAPVPDKTLRIPDSPIVIPLLQIMRR